MSAAFDWLSRVIMLVLAGLVTLSIIGAIASIPSGSIGDRIGFERGEQLPPPAQVADEEAAVPLTTSDGNRTGMETHISTRSLVTEPEKREPADWLEAITYALIALVGLAALGCVLLWRIANSLSTLRREI